MGQRREKLKRGTHRALSKGSGSAMVGATGLLVCRVLLLTMWKLSVDAPPPAAQAHQLRGPGAAKQPNGRPSPPPLGPFQSCPSLSLFHRSYEHSLVGAYSPPTAALFSRNIVQPLQDPNSVSCYYPGSLAPAKQSKLTDVTIFIQAHCSPNPAPTATMLKPTPAPVDILILGAGWTSTFLIPLIAAPHRSTTLSTTNPLPGFPLPSTLPNTPLTYAATSTNSRPDPLGRPTLPFRFDPADPSTAPYATLPHATTILITFPLTGPGQSAHLVAQYRAVHGPHAGRFVQLGSSSIFTAPRWNTHASPHDAANARAVAEDELLALGGVVLNLAGLYGGVRDPREWVVRVAKSKEEVKGKKALHLVHGEDVARGILAVHFRWERALGVEGKKDKGVRWLLTDLHVYDWWDLIQSWGPVAAERFVEKGRGTPEEAAKLRYAEWVGELMGEEDVRALPRAAETLGRVLDSRDFWRTMDVWPVMGRVMS
ncbi:hypothetical protein FH972_025787 [Carpinus fangiana]|uniref:Uncharacterized protein n=1 Tax=Carpinus fangiana TaxID=176857 RepID=A0A5N6L213_9ROSI|nr:hypothetical protein FH972_025787 [Carpinus fangiana]